jgi:hypothetical protein
MSMLLLLLLLPPIPPRQKGKRGPVAKLDAHSLWERLQRHEDAVLYLARDPHVHLTNNRAERDLRMSKVKQKVSGCFKTGQLPGLLPHRRLIADHDRQKIQSSRRHT